MRLAVVVQWIRTGLLAGIVISAAIARADDGATFPYAGDSSAPERLLAADSILYWRFDGWTQHQAAFDRTAFADVLRGGSGEFLGFCQRFACKQLSDTTLSQPLLAGRRPSELKILRAAAKQLPLLWPAIEQHGMAVGIESAGDRQSPRLTAVLPQGKPLYLVARLLATQFANAPVERRVQGRLVLVSEPQSVGGTANQTASASVDSGAQKIDSPCNEAAGNASITDAAKSNTTATAAKTSAVKSASGSHSQQPPKQSEPVRTLAWIEGNDLVIVVAAQTSDEMVSSVLGRRSRNLLRNSLFKEVATFKDYEVLSRGFADVQPALRDVAKVTGLDSLPAIVAAAGFANVRQLSWHTGVEGRHHRYTIDFDIPGERKGILNLFGGPTLRANDKLPPLPPDVNQFHLFSLRMAGIDDIAAAAPLAAQIYGAGDAAKAQPAAGAPAPSATTKQDIDIQRDLLNSLGPRLLVYNSPSEGPFFTGAAVAIETTKPDKLRKLLDQVAKLAAGTFGEAVQILHCKRHGVDVVTVRFPSTGNNNGAVQLGPMPSFAVHNGWLVVAAYPQTIDGFILRSASEAPQLSESLSRTPSNSINSPGTYQTWQPSPLLRQIVAKTARRSPAMRILSIHESDPRPIIRFALSASPIAGSLINAMDSDQFDNRLIPNVQSVVEPLYPNVSIVTDDGRRVRVDGYKSAPFPFDSSFALVPGYIFLLNAFN
jgi:hypothetical protein